MTIPSKLTPPYLLGQSYTIFQSVVSIYHDESFASSTAYILILAKALSMNFAGASRK